MYKENCIGINIFIQNKIKFIVTICSCSHALTNNNREILEEILPFVKISINKKV